MRIQHNIAALNSYRNLTNNNSAVSKNLEKLSSGYRINRAGDDAAGLAISEKMRAQITGLKTAQKNANDGISLVQTAEGAMTEIHSMLNRMVELADQSANGTYADEVDRENLQKEITSLKDEINRIADATNFNGINLLDGSLSSTGKSASLAEADLSKLTGDLAGAIKTVDAVKGAYENMNEFTALTGKAEGDQFTASYTFEDANGNTQKVDITLTVGKDSAGALKKLVAADGSEYDLVNAGAATKTELASAIATELNKNSVVKANFTAAVATADDGTEKGQVTLTSKTAGTESMKLVGFEERTYVKATGATTVVQNGASTKTEAADAFETVDLSKGKIWQANNTAKGSNDLDKCIFEINGEKFVFVENGKINADSLAELKEAGVEHYVEIETATAAGDATKGIAAADVKAMAEKISMETGLSVEVGEASTTDNVTSWTKNDAKTMIALKSRTTGSTKSGGLTLQIGDTSADFNQLRVSVSDMHAKALGIADIDISTQAGAKAAVDKIKDAINSVSSTRGDLGAIQNRLEHTINNLSVTTENMTAAESRIRDVDMAEEMMAYTKNNILVQASQAMLAQANQIPQGVLQLLQ